VIQEQLQRRSAQRIAVTRPIVDIHELSEKVQKLVAELRHAIDQNDFDTGKQVIDSMLTIELNNATYASAILANILLCSIDLVNVLYEICRYGPTFNSLFDHVIANYNKIYTARMKRFMGVDFERSGHILIMKAIVYHNVHQITELLKFDIDLFQEYDNVSPFKMVVDYEYIELFKIFMKYLYDNKKTYTPNQIHVLTNVINDCNNQDILDIFFCYTTNFDFLATRIIHNKLPSSIYSIVQCVKTRNLTSELMIEAATRGILSAFIYWRMYYFAKYQRLLSTVRCDDKSIMFHAILSANPLLIIHLLDQNLTIDLEMIQMMNSQIMMEGIGFSDLMKHPKYIACLLRTDPNSLLSVIPRDIFNLIHELLPPVPIANLDDLPDLEHIDPRLTADDSDSDDDDDDDDSDNNDSDDIYASIVDDVTEDYDDNDETYDSDDNLPPLEQY
jgi:hypothetical protein